jgi:PAS domain S-box-containing protein
MIPCAKSHTEYFRYSRQFYHLIFDVHGNCCYGNFLFQQNFQYASLSNEEQNKFVWGINNCLEKSTTAVTVETTLKSREGNFVSVQWELSPIKNEDEDVEGIQAVGINKPCAVDRSAINAKKVIEEDFHRLINSLQFGVTVRDASGKALFCNERALEFTGWTLKEFLKTTSPGKKFFFINEDGSTMLEEQHPTRVVMKTREPVQDVVLGIYREKKKECKWALMSAKPVLDKDGQLQHVVTTFIDITERKRLEKKLIDAEIDKQKIIARAGIAGQEKERRQISNELHDNVNQLLTTTLLYLENAKASAGENADEMIAMSSKFVGDAINEIRKLSKTLTPPTLGQLGLVGSVKDLCQSIKTTQAFAVRFYHKDFDETALAEDAKLTFYRIIQEQIKNIISHSEASSILVKLISKSNKATLVIADNGKGFDFLKIKRGLGLTNIINRAELFNGKAEITSSPGKGCLINVTIPAE